MLQTVKLSSGRNCRHLLHGLRAAAGRGRRAAAHDTPPVPPQGESYLVRRNKLSLLSDGGHRGEDAGAGAGGPAVRAGAGRVGDREATLYYHFTQFRDRYLLQLKTKVGEEDPSLRL